jgi:hypothetical protein
VDFEVGARGADGLCERLNRCWVHQRVVGGVVDLDGHLLRPALDAKASWVQPAAHQQCSARPRPGGGKELGGPAAHGEAGIDGAGRQAVDTLLRAADQLRDAERIALCRALVQVVEGLAVEGVDRVDGVAGRAQARGELQHARAQAQGGVKQRDRGHCAS